MHCHFLKFCFLISVSLASKGGQWKYGDTVGHVYGPKDWGHVSKHCDENAQSPVDIITYLVQKDLDLKQVKISSDRKNGQVVGELSNNGHAPTLKTDKSYSTANLSGGPLGDSVFELEQLHFHFGCKRREGSEHTVNGRALSGELHLVFYNKKYPDFATAVDKADGLAVVGVFFKERRKGNRVVRRLSRLMRNIADPGSTTDVKRKNKVILSGLVPNLNNYYTYQGSLTTPPCFQSVTWIVVTPENSIGLGKKAIRTLRALNTHEGKSMCGNYRPTQSLNGRTVRGPVA